MTYLWRFVEGCEPSARLTIKLHQMYAFSMIVESDQADKQLAKRHQF